MPAYQGYPSYKDSGYKQLDTIPSHWGVSKIKFVSHCLDGKRVPLNSEERSYMPGEYPYWGANGILDHVNDWIFDDDLILVGEDGAPFFDENKDVAFRVSGKVWVNNHAHILKPRLTSVSREYLTYALNRVDYYLYINGSTRDKLTQGDLGNIIFQLPPVDEQTQIATFLDRETAKIDQLIDKQQQLIKLLEEKRQAVISHAITKGLNPDTPIKDSGVKWLGEVPEHWTCLPAKRIFRLATEPAPANNDEELLSVYTDIGVRPRRELEARGNKASTTDGYWRVKRGDIIVNKLLAWMGACGYSDYDGVTSPAYDILRPIRPTNTKFYHYLFRSKIAQTEFKRWSRGIMEMRLRLYFDELGRIVIPIPPLDEQSRIVSSIELMEQKFDKLSSKATDAIALLQERRTALISAAVTGKIDVRHPNPHPTGEHSSSKSAIPADM